MDKRLAKTHIGEGIIVALDFHSTSYKAQYEIWVRQRRCDEQYSWTIEAKAQTLGRAQQLYNSQVAALQAV